jgi:hypothetical protein
MYTANVSKDGNGKVIHIYKNASTTFAVRGSFYQFEKDLIASIPVSVKDLEEYDVALSLTPLVFIKDKGNVFSQPVHAEVIADLFERKQFKNFTQLVKILFS